MAETTDQYRTRINQLKTNIENEPYMKNMRENIAEGISKTGNRHADIEVRQDKLEDDFVAVQQDTSSASPSGAEVTVARGSYPTLDERLTKKEQEVTAQFVQNSRSNPVSVNKFASIIFIGDWTPYIEQAIQEAKENGVKAIKFNAGIYKTSYRFTEEIDVYGAGKSDTVIQFMLSDGYAVTGNGSHLNPTKYHELTLMAHDDYRENSTLSGVLIDNGWGKAVDFDNVQISYFPNMLLDIKDGFGSYFKNTTFRGYIDPNGERKTKLLRLSYNQYQFSNQNTFSNCVFVDARTMLDFKGTANNNFIQCTFQDADLFMAMESVEGKGDNSVNFINCWYEEFEKGIINSKINEATLEPVLPLVGITDISKVRNTNNAFSNDGYNMPEFWLNSIVEPFWYKHYSMHDDNDYQRHWKQVTGSAITIDQASQRSGAVQNASIKWGSFTELMMVCKTLSNNNTSIILPKQALMTFGWLTVPIADRPTGAKRLVLLSSNTSYLNVSISYESDITEVTALYIR